MKILRKHLALLLAAGFGLLATHAVAVELTVVSWGGAYSKSQQLAYYEPYIEMTGITIINDDSSPEAVAKLRAMNEAGNTSWDLVDVVAADAIRLCDEGLVEEVDFDNRLAAAPDGTPATVDFGDMIVSPCFIPEIVYSTTFGYRTDLVNGAPTGIEDVFNLEKFPGKRALEKRPINNMEWALLADGVAAEDVYDTLETEEGIARAFAKLDTIKDQVIWWSNASQPPQMLADGEIVIGSTYNGRLFSMIAEEQQPVAILWDWQIFDLSGWVVPVGTDKKEEVYDFLRFATDTQRLADQAKYISYGPARQSSAPLVGKHAELGIDMAPHMPTDPNNSRTRLIYNYEWWADNRDDMDQRFQAWLAQ